jgi:hypothetical protein
MRRYVKCSVLSTFPGVFVLHDLLEARLGDLLESFVWRCEDGARLLGVAQPGHEARLFHGLSKLRETPVLKTKRDIIDESCFRDFPVTSPSRLIYPNVKSWGTWFDPRLDYRLPWLRLFAIFLVSYANSGTGPWNRPRLSPSNDSQSTSCLTARFDLFTAMKIHIDAFWIVTPCSNVAG